MTPMVLLPFLHISSCSCSFILHLFHLSFRWKQNLRALHHFQQTCSNTTVKTWRTTSRTELATDQSIYRLLNSIYIHIGIFRSKTFKYIQRVVETKIRFNWLEWVFWNRSQAIYVLTRIRPSISSALILKCDSVVSRKKPVCCAIALQIIKSCTKTLATIQNGAPR